MIIKILSFNMPLTRCKIGHDNLHKSGTVGLRFLNNSLETTSGLDTFSLKQVKEKQITPTSVFHLLSCFAQNRRKDLAEKSRIN